MVFTGSSFGFGGFSYGGFHSPYWNPYRPYDFYRGYYRGPRLGHWVLLSLPETLDMVLTIMLLITGIIILDTEIMLITDLIQGLV